LPKVSVIIPVYNAEKFLSETIESVIAQTYPDWEIIAVDDGSTDRSLEILRKYEQRLPSKIHVITQRNSGVSIARNNAIAIAKGEYIAFLDHDDS
jgi:glycosyltransferase involved in cell wall biosynthesis